MTPDMDRIDAVVVRRLARLGAMPVDTSALERTVRGQIDGPVARTGTNWQGILRPMAAVAASLLMVVMFILALQGREVMASGAEMAQMHRDIVSGRVETMKVDSIEKANEAIAAMGGVTEGFPTLAVPPESHTMACCMRNVGNKKVACVLFNNGTTPVTMAVAEGAAMAMDGATAEVYRGQTFYVQTSGELTMVTFNRAGRHVCLIGALAGERLMAMTEGLKF